MAKATYDKQGTPAAHARMKAAQMKAMVEARRWATSPIGLQYVGMEADRRKWAFPKKFRVEQVLAEENKRRAVRRAALRAGAVEPQPWKANTGDKDARFGAHRALLGPTISGEEVDDLRRENMGNASLLVAITRHPRTRVSTLEVLAQFHPNAEVQSQARTVLQRRAKNAANARARKRARAAAAASQGAPGATTQAA